MVFCWGVALLSILVIILVREVWAGMFTTEAHVSAMLRRPQWSILDKARALWPRLPPPPPALPLHLSGH